MAQHQQQQQDRREAGATGTSSAAIRAAQHADTWLLQVAYMSVTFHLHVINCMLCSGATTTSCAFTPAAVLLLLPLLLPSTHVCLRQVPVE
jgi:hypothetical protein